MRDLPLPARRGLALLAWALPLALLLSPLGLWFIGLLFLLGFVLTAMLWLGLGEELAWSLTFACHAPRAWWAASPGPWWTALARRSDLPPLVLGALHRAEAWGDREATYELALEALATGVSTLADSGVHRLRPLAAAGHRPAQAALAGALAWGVGVLRDPKEAERLWVRSGGAPEAPIPPPPPSLLKARREAQAPSAALCEALGRAGEHLSDLLARQAAARWVLGLSVAVTGGTLLLVPVTFLLMMLLSGGGMGAASRQLAGLLLVVLTPLGLLLVWIGRQVRSAGPGTRQLRKILARAEAGDPEAAFQMALAYDRGTPDTPREASEARRWYRVAAEGGHAEAALRLADLLQMGHGGLKDPAAAAAWRARAGGTNPARPAEPPVDPLPEERA